MLKINKTAGADNAGATDKPNRNYVNSYLLVGSGLQLIRLSRDAET